MARKNKKHSLSGLPAADTVPVSSSFLPKSNLKFLIAGVFLTFFGFVLLSFTDSLGQNAASRLSPFLVLGGYALIGFALFKSPVNP
jgi:H+/Cl- antiporter ClcA